MGLTIPKKNPIEIYNLLFRPLLHSQGLWDQVCGDHGTKFALILTAQRSLSHLRRNQSCEPVLCSLSRLNHRVEHLWPEVNQRINYPVKRLLIAMENEEEIPPAFKLRGSSALHPTSDTTTGTTGTAGTQTRPRHVVAHAAPRRITQPSRSARPAAVEPSPSRCHDHCVFYREVEEPTHRVCGPLLSLGVFQAGSVPLGAVP